MSSRSLWPTCRRCVANISCGDGAQCTHACARALAHLALPAAIRARPQNEEDAYRNIRLRVEDVQGRNCLTNFWVRLHAAGSGG